MSVSSFPSRQEDEVWGVRTGQCWVPCETAGSVTGDASVGDRVLQHLGTRSESPGFPLGFSPVLLRVAFC